MLKHPTAQCQKAVIERSRGQWRVTRPSAQRQRRTGEPKARMDVGPAHDDQRRLGEQQQDPRRDDETVEVVKGARAASSENEAVV